MATETTRNDADQVVSVEDHLAMALAEFDHALAAAKEMRDRLALRLHALQMAGDDRIPVAVDDYEQRISEGRPYEDATSVEELVAEARSSL